MGIGGGGGDEWTRRMNRMPVVPISPMLQGENRGVYPQAMKYFETYKQIYWYLLPVDPAALEEGFVRDTLSQRHHTIESNPLSLSLYTALTWGAIGVGDRHSADVYFERCRAILGDVFDVEDRSTLLALLPLSLYAVTSSSLGGVSVASYFLHIARLSSQRLKCFEDRVLLQLVMLECLKKAERESSIPTLPPSESGSPSSSSSPSSPSSPSSSSTTADEAAIEKRELVRLIRVYRHHVDTDPPSVTDVMRAFNDGPATLITSTSATSNTTTTAPAAHVLDGIFSPDPRDDIERFSNHISTLLFNCLFTFYLTGPVNTAPVSSSASSATPSSSSKQRHFSSSSSSSSTSSSPFVLRNVEVELKTTSSALEQLRLLLFNKLPNSEEEEEETPPSSTQPTTTDSSRPPVNSVNTQTSANRVEDEEGGFCQQIFSSLHAVEKKLFNRKRSKHPLPLTIHWSWILLVQGTRAMVLWHMGDKEEALKVAIQFCKRIDKLCRSIPFMVPMFIPVVHRVCTIFELMGRNDLVDRLLRVLKALGLVFPCFAAIQQRLDENRSRKKLKASKKKEYKFHHIG